MYFRNVFQTSAVNDEHTPVTDHTTSLDTTIVKLLEIDDDSKDNAENTIPYSTSDYLERVDWSGHAIVEGKKGFIPAQLPPIMQRLNMRPEQYLAYVRKPKYGFANALGVLDKVKACAENFEKAFLSPPYSPWCRSEGPTGSVAGAFCDRAHRKRTRLYVEDARPSKTPWTRGMAASQ
ncbi:MAG: hypothetical protein WD397_08135 [Wenzhouxiangellaceae bacterium]